MSYVWKEVLASSIDNRASQKCTRRIRLWNLWSYLVRSFIITQTPERKSYSSSYLWCLRTKFLTQKVSSWSCCKVRLLIQYLSIGQTKLIQLPKYWDQIYNLKFISLPDTPNESDQINLAKIRQQGLSLNIHPVLPKQGPDISIQQQHIRSHQMPSNTIQVSYNQMINPTPLSTLHIPQTLVETTSAGIHNPSNINMTRSMQSSTDTLNSSAFGITGLSGSSQVSLKAEYTEPKLEYSWSIQ